MQEYGFEVIVPLVKYREGQQANPLFFLVYGFEVILPVDLTWILPRIELYNKDEVDST